MEVIDSALKSLIDDILSASIVVGPALGSVGVGGIDPDTYLIIENATQELTDKFWSNPAAPTRHLEFVVPPSVIKTCFIETLSSTAAYLSHLHLGYLNIDESMVRVAERLLEKFIQDHTTDNVLTLNFLANSYDNLQLLKHYGEVRQEQFESGELHRPWIHYSLQPELEFMLSAGTVEATHKTGISYVQLTDCGQHQHGILKDFFTETGFLRRRSALMRLSQFSQLDDYDELIENAFEMAAMRKTLCEHSGIQEGMQVLELGAGTGGLTIDAGLYKLVGPTGKVVATEPSLGMLDRAKRKSEQLGIGSIQFIQTAAEELPFPDNTFDAVTGNSFIFFTDIPVVMKEVHRVLKPDGIFSTSVPLTPEHPRFMAEWFAPVMAMVVPRSRRDIGPGPDIVTNAMNGLFDDISIRHERFASVYDNPTNVVRYVFQVANVFEDAMNELPWKAKEDMLQRLVERGKDIVSMYPASELRPLHPCQIIRARAVKANELPSASG